MEKQKESPKKSKSKQGKKNRAAGARFELKVRGDLENRGWIIDKWTNNIDLEKKKLVKVKNKFRGKGIPMMLGAGFPDFIGFKCHEKRYNVIGIEAKRNGWLDKQEKEKSKLLLKARVFNKILIAKKGKKRGMIEYIDFKEYNKQKCKTE